MDRLAFAQVTAQTHTQRFHKRGKGKLVIVYDLARDKFLALDAQAPLGEQQVCVLALTKHKFRDMSIYYDYDAGDMDDVCDALYNYLASDADNVWKAVVDKIGKGTI